MAPVLDVRDTPPPPLMRLALQVRIKLGEPMEIGRIDDGLRRIVAIEGGVFEGVCPDGETFQGDILPFGGDWQVVRQGGRIDLDARYTLRTDRGEPLFVSNIGARFVGPEAAQALLNGQAIDQTRSRSHGYMRIETGQGRLAWMNDRLFIPRGRRGAQYLQIAFYDWD